MTTPFRLIAAHLARQDARDNYPGLDSRLGRVAFSNSSDRSLGTYATLIIGNNGSGKSRLFSAIAETFYLLSTGYSGSRIPLDYLHYRLGDNDYLITRKSPSRFLYRRNGVIITKGQLSFPAKILALTLTPFDKFPLLKRAHADEFHPLHSPQIYSYLGTRDATGKSSIFSLLYRSIERLTSRISTDKDSVTNVAGVFTFLGFKPKIRLIYKLSAYRQQLLDISEGRTESQSGSGWSAYFVDQVSRTRKTYDISDKDITSAAQNISSLFAEERHISVQIDLENASADSEFLFELNFFRALRILKLSSVEIERNDGVSVDLKTSSSGELSIVTAFLALATEIDNSSLILVDEPEISLHPEWQTAYMRLLLGTFAKFSGCHYAIATHSPLILSDVDKTPSHVVSLDTQSGIPVSSVAGHSPDQLLVDAFHVLTRDNLYIKQQIISALRLIADGKLESPQFKKLEKQLSKVASFLPANDDRGELLRDILHARTKKPR